MKVLGDSPSGLQYAGMITFIVNNLNKISVFGLILLAAASVIFGDFAAKLWSTNHNNNWYAIALVGYFLSGVFYIPTLLREGLVITSILWSVLSIIGFLAIGLIIFRESVSNLQILGILLGVVSIVILTMVE